MSNVRLPGFFKHFVNLFFPDTCHVCRGLLAGQEVFLCSYCQTSLPRTRFHQHSDNALTRIFWGRVQIQTGTALYHFHKKGGVQRLVHAFKYQGNTRLGEHLGMLLGRDIKRSPYYGDITAIIPVPLHPDKEKKRGFNQSEVFARGLSATLSIPCYTDWLVRIIDNPTQTKRSRIDRWENVYSSFKINKPEQVSHAQILLVDDVITTGATLEACAQELLSVKGARIWIATLAITA